MCLYPRLIKNPKYKENKKNGGKIPAVSDARVLYVAVGCSNCIECRKQKSNEWRIRLMEDIKQHKNGHFITLTFSNQSILKLSNDVIHRKDEHGNINRLLIKDLKGYERDNAIAIRAIRLFLERWRKKYKKSIRHWLVTELGHQGTENIHLHGIVFTDHIHDVKQIWQYGYVWDGYTKNGRRVNYVNNKTINYCVKYITKQDLKHKYYKSQILCSAGIGNNYTNSYNSKLNKFNESKTEETYRTESGHKIAMPTYWRNKIYNDEEREALWLHRLDKNVRYVCGEKYDVSKSQDEYFNALLHHRIRNKKLGYGSYIKDWTIEQYEKDRRDMLYNHRIENI